MLAGQRDQPQREFGEVDCGGVSINPVEATLGDQTAREHDLVFVGRNRRCHAMGMPRRHQRIAKLTTGLHQKRAGTHGRVADLDVQDLVRS